MTEVGLYGVREMSVCLCVCVCVCVCVCGKELFGVGYYSLAI